MVDNQHRMIKGYRDLSEDEIATINSIKEFGEEIRKLVDRVRELPDVDQRWAAIANTNFQQGLMALVRSVARPDFY